MAIDGKIKCPKCDYPNAAQRKRCSECGADLLSPAPVKPESAPAPAAAAIPGNLPAAASEPYMGPDITTLRTSKSWFVGVNDGGYVRYYDKAQVKKDLRAEILAGKYSKDTQVAEHYKIVGGDWKEVGKSIGQLAKGHFALRILYQPVWTHVISGLKWGAIVGVALKMLDTFAGLWMEDEKKAALFFISVGACFLPRIGLFIIVPAVVLMSQYSPANFMVMALASATCGAILGLLPGMAIGGLTGLIRKNSLPLAPDAAPEKGANIFTVFILPLAGGLILIYLYLFVFVPWLFEVVEKL